MSHHFRSLASLSIVLLGCATTQPVAGIDVAGTGLEGVVRRGPITPVCRVDQPCDAPFAASFEIRHGQDLVARFRSDSAGLFRVALLPGSYTVVPDSTAPLLGASHQAQPVIVGPEGLTHVELDFDTGIR
jgi:hypothetical protein